MTKGKAKGPASEPERPVPLHMVWQAGVRFGWLDLLKTACGWKWVVTTQIEWPDGGEVAVVHQKPTQRSTMQGFAPDWWMRLREWGGK